MKLSARQSKCASQRHFKFFLCPNVTSQISSTQSNMFRRLNKSVISKYFACMIIRMFLKHFNDNFTNSTSAQCITIIDVLVHRSSTLYVVCKTSIIQEVQKWLIKVFKTPSSFPTTIYLETHMNMIQLRNSAALFSSVSISLINLIQ